MNAATLAGHVTVEDFATIGALSPVHQFCRIGSYAYIGASTVITQDVPPFSRVVTERETKCFRRECHRPGAQRIFRRARENLAAARFASAALENEYHAGAEEMRATSAILRTFANW